MSPNFTKLKDIRGDRVPKGNRAEAIAEFLQDKQWANREMTPMRERETIIDEDLPIDTGPVESEELRNVIGKLKNHKAAGPDRTTSEMFKQLDQGNLETMGRILTSIWGEAKLQEFMTHANIASIFKKGDIEQLDNYRPISLLNIMYKICAAIIQKRLAKGTRLQKTQYGFRANRSTSQALYIARRLLENGESGLENIVLVLLDWEKRLIAFPSLNLCKH